MPSCRSLRPLVVLLFTALLATLLPVQTAGAAERTVLGGRLDWGVKSSFQTYVTGPIAKGSWSLNGGAGTVGQSQFRFHSATGGYDPDTGAFRAGFAGGVRFVGHQKANGEYELDLTVSRPTVRISGGSGTLHVDVRSKAKDTGQVTTRSQVAFATLGLGGVDMRGGGSPVSLSGVPATLTAAGAQSFAGYYTAGTPLDPVSLSVDVKAPAAPQKPADPGDGDAEEKKDEKKDADKADKKAEGAVADAALDWGVRRTFREYVSGPIADGGWKLTGGARDGGALFRFPEGKGSYDAEKDTLSLDFAGSVHFTGKDVDVELTEVSVKVADGKGTLRAAGDPLVTFDAPLKPKKQLIHIEEAPARLTAQGAALFGSMYRQGTEMDPVTLAVALGKSAELPALPDLGSEPTAEPSPSPAAKKADTGAEDTATESTSATSNSPLLFLSLAAAAVLAALAAALWFVRRRRTATTTPDSEE